MEPPEAPIDHRVYVGASFDFISDDLLHNILSRLPAVSFASAACVNSSWNTVCSRILRHPKLSAALSFNQSLQGAVDEVVNKVLAEPIRPHFAILYVGPYFDWQQAHQLIIGKLGSKTPIITSVPAGIIGRDAVSSDFKEVQWEVTGDDDEDGENMNDSINRSVSLIVGFMPGFKVNAIPLLMPNEQRQVPMVDNFVMGIKEYTATVSVCTSPAAIIMFGDSDSSMKPVLEKMDYAMSSETVIVGDASCQFLYRDNSGGATSINDFTSVAVALVFARDFYRHHSIGEIQFQAALSSGLSPIGPTYKAASVREKPYDGLTWLTARREGQRENLDGETIINQVYDELGHRIQFPTFYIGVTKRRKCSIGLDKTGWITSLSFHEVMGDNQEYLFVGDVGIRTGDSFRFYHSDHNVALSSCSKVSNILKEKDNVRPLRSDIVDTGKREVFGGIIFACCGRGEPLFGQRNVDSSPFLDNYPGVPVAGSFCGGEIGRGDLSSYTEEEAQAKESVRCCLHVFSSVYLVLSYFPPLWN